MDRRLVSSGSPYEPIVGFSRAVVAGHHVAVSGTAPIMPDGADPPADAYGQTRRCLEIIAEALAEAGAGLGDVVRTRAFLTTDEAFDGYARAHGEAFSAIRPANSAVIVAALLDRRWFVEIEADAILPDA
jgi:enamine deaminase RidA (YjgF/YER057c/UK114 family)